ncbi:alpha/beta-hydrolase [Byssothecium circinans]|uniref:Alpha/beta-hydrolase n=1 Tax=Byssothecium circinans TaxID=147558 RepID=A0A6A5TGV3_9PLEO|nr:alpha/beta-hydrolase [Byssothecium circinans]KAF1948127.1 alpha/beta-hydrolase [Byssothecium circinans]
MNSLSGISSYGALNTSGISSPAFSYSAGGNAVCVSGIVNVPVVATTVEVLYKGPANNYELTEFISNFLRRDSDTFATSIGGTNTVSDTFAIYSKLCVPADPKSTKNLTSIHVLAHGGTLTHTYWDFAPGYSYVDAAAVKGYATFSYDRLGTGKSDHPDPWQVVQVPLQVELAHALVQKVRNGKIGGMAFQKVVGVGHSLGAALTQGVSRLHPDDLDAVALTGHSAFFEGSGTGFAAAAQQISNTLPDRPELKELPNGYFTLGPVLQALHFAFFYYPHFDTKIFTKEFEARHSNAIGETLTLGGIYLPTNFTKPVQILNGQQDWFYCQGNCLAGEGDVTADALALFYPDRDASKSQAITIPNMGHNINLHYGRLEAFEKILNFISEAGIKP